MAKETYKGKSLKQWNKKLKGSGYQIATILIVTNEDGRPIIDGQSFDHFQSLTTAVQFIKARLKDQGDGIQDTIRKARQSLEERIQRIENAETEEGVRETIREAFNATVEEKEAIENLLFSNQLRSSESSPSD